MNDENTPQQPTVPNAEVSSEPTTEPVRGRKPDYIVQHIPDGNNSRWSDIGAAWTGKNGYIKPIIPVIPEGGSIILQPRKELERLRQEKANRQSEPQQEVVKETTQNP